jgi:hypothetical protein
MAAWKHIIYGKSTPNPLLTGGDGMNNSPQISLLNREEGLRGETIET